MRLSACLATLTVLCAAPALAQSSWPSGLTADGRLAFGYTDRVPGAEVFLFGDATLRLDGSAFGLGLPIGIELGVFGRATALDTPHETYGALTWDLPQGGRVSVGVPRPAYDSFAVSALEAAFPDLAIDRAGSTRSLATFGAMFANFLPYGIRFENFAGDLRYAVSVHDASNMDTTIAGVGLAYPVGDWTLEGAVEVAWGVTTDVGAKVQARGDLGPVDRRGRILFARHGRRGGSDRGLRGLFAAGRR